MKSQRSVKNHDKWLELLSAVFTLCALDSSLKESDLVRLIAASRVLAAKKARVFSPKRRGTIDLDALGHVVYRWKRSAKYLDKNGLPLDLSARGPAPSIQALFSDIKKTSYFERGMRHLTQLGRIRKKQNGKYSPAAEVSIVQTLRPELAKLVAHTVNRLLETVVHNTSLRDPKALRLVERVTAVPDLHKRHSQAFKLFAREQGGALINTMNDWLEGRRGKRNSRRSRSKDHLTAGLHVFAFVDQSTKGL